MTKKEPVARPGKPYDSPIPTRSKWADRLNKRPKPVREVEDAARQEIAYPEDETNEG